MLLISFLEIEERKVKLKCGFFLSLSFRILGDGTPQRDWIEAVAECAPGGGEYLGNTVIHIFCNPW